MRVSRAARRRPAAMNREPVRGFVRLDTKTAKSGDDGRDPVALFDAELAGAANRHLTSVRGQSGNRWKLIDERGNLVGRDLDAARVIAFNRNRAPRLTGHAAGHIDGHPGAKSSQHANQGSPGRVETDVLDHNAGSREGCGCHQPEGCRREIARHLNVDAAELTRVIARRSRLSNGGLAVYLQACQEHGRLHLCAGNGRPVIDCLKVSAVNDQGCMTGSRLDAGAHRFERLYDTPHWPPRQRGVADEGAGEELSRNHAGQQAHRRAGVARVEWYGWRTESFGPSSQYSDHAIRISFDIDSKRAQTGQRGPTIGTRRVPGQPRTTIRDRGKQGIAMRNGLVSGDTQTALNLTGRADRCGGHGAILRYSVRGSAAQRLDMAGEMVLTRRRS